VFAVLAALVAALPAPSPAPGCSNATFRALDFWLGTWTVTVGSQYAGTDVVTRELEGCAVTEKWTDADGSHGQSLFFYDGFAGRWQQIWVTDDSTRVGGLKYKTLVGQYPGGGVRFQGILPSPPGRTPILDRTTLTPLHDGTVHQVIEISKDGGNNWIAGFDAIYHPVRQGARFGEF
jgi:hypothetical protein